MIADESVFIADGAKLSGEDVKISEKGKEDERMNKDDSGGFPYL